MSILLSKGMAKWVFDKATCIMSNHEPGPESGLSAFGAEEERMYEMAVKATENYRGIYIVLQLSWWRR